MSSLPLALPVATLWFSPGLPEGARAFSRDADAVPVDSSTHGCPWARVLRLSLVGDGVCCVLAPAFLF